MRPDSLKPFIKGICSDVWTLHIMIRNLEKENRWLKRKINKLVKDKK